MEVESEPMLSAQGKPATGAATEGAGGPGEVVVDSGGSELAKFLQFLGPGILVAAVYVDPGQIVVDMESGSTFGYKLLWACLLANLMGLMFQHLCSRLSVVTSRNLAEECRLEYPQGVRIFLWLTVELASIAADVGYVMGTATALSILFGIELHWGVLITGLDTFVALGLQFWGIRKVELLVGVLFTCIIAAYFMEITLISPTASEVADGLLPRLWHRNSKYSYGVWLELLCANLGAAVCPPNFYLQSALVLTRRIERTDKEVRSAFRHNFYETAFCLGIATAINLVMLILAGTVFFPDRVVSLEQGATLLEQTLGGTARSAFAVAMLCAGQSSSLSGVLSTQYIMEGFFELSLPSWLIRLVTRLVAISPAFYIVYTYGPESAAEMIEQAQVVVNFVVPFTVIPLTKFLSSELKMGQFRLSPALKMACWLSAAVAILLNLLSMCQTLLGLEEELGAAVAYPLLALSLGLYLGMSAYLMRREVVVGQHAHLPSAGPNRAREAWLCSALKQIHVMYYVGGALLATAMGALMWLDVLAPRYNRMAGII